MYWLKITAGFFISCFFILPFFKVEDPLRSIALRFFSSEGQYMNIFVIRTEFIDTNIYWIRKNINSGMMAMSKHLTMKYLKH